MAASDHLNQVQHKELPGTAKNPQGRLFAPTGMYTGDPWRLAPENWMKQSATPAHSDPIAWHSSHSSALPRYDDPGSRAMEPDMDYDDYEDEERDDFSVDTKDRPMAEYGSAIGMHLGSLEAAVDRAKTDVRNYSHPARIPSETIKEAPSGNFFTQRRHANVSGSLRSERTILNAETGERTLDKRWSDPAANYAERATDLVEKGHTLPYRNDVEGQGSTSYRTLPETVRTWSEDVLNATSPRTETPAGVGHSDVQWQDPHAFRNEPHPAMVEAAKAGYNPVALTHDKDVAYESRQSPLFGDDLSTYVQQNQSRRDAFHAGRITHLRKPVEERYDYDF